ncbi:hypothetical protein GCM10022284_24970 [Streptomyces hundungensis]
MGVGAGESVSGRRPRPGPARPLRSYPTEGRGQRAVPGWAWLSGPWPAAWRGKRAVAGGFGY